MNRLLNRSMKTFVTYTALVLACSIPAYYFIIDWIWEHELKEHNRIVSTTIKKNLQSLSFSDTAMAEKVALWNQLRPETPLLPADKLRPDSVYNVYRRNVYIPEKGMDRFQGLVTFFEINGKPYSLTVEGNMEESYETVIAIAAVTFLFFFILLGGFIWLNRRSSVKLWQPFYKSLHKIESFDLNSREKVVFEPTDITEFHMLNQNLDKLIAGNIAAFNRQKEFTENASHELQTPLAIVKSKLDLLVQSTPLTSGQIDLIDQTHQALSRVSRINRNLLLLAKMDNSQFPETETILLSALLEEQMKMCRDLAEEQEITQDIRPDVVIAGNKVLVEILLTNLLMNAIRYSAPDAAIHVALQENRILVANSGTAALVTKNLFKRFASAATDVPGTGLGLAIVEQICHRYGWKVDYRFEDGRHVFIVLFVGMTALSLHNP